MDRVCHLRKESLEPAYSPRFQDALHRTFVACQEPMPEEMEKILARLRMHEASVARGPDT
jgi:hypothetical protein